MNTTLHITIDKTTKEASQRLAKDMGLDLSTIVKASLRAFVDTKIFHVEKADRMTPYLERIISQARAERKAGQTYGTFKNGKELDDFLMS